MTFLHTVWETFYTLSRAARAVPDPSRSQAFAVILLPLRKIYCQSLPRRVLTCYKSHKRKELVFGSIVLFKRIFFYFLFAEVAKVPVLSVTMWQIMRCVSCEMDMELVEIKQRAGQVFPESKMNPPGSSRFDLHAGPSLRWDNAIGMQRKLSKFLESVCRNINPVIYQKKCCLHLPLFVIGCRRRKRLYLLYGFVGSYGFVPESPQSHPITKSLSSLVTN